MRNLIPLFKGFIAFRFSEPGYYEPMEVGESLDDLKKRLKKSWHWLDNNEIESMKFLEEASSDLTDCIVAFPCSERVYYTWLKYGASKWEISIDGVYHPQDWGMPNYYDQEDLLPDSIKETL